jgi:hypothetical protein
VARAAAAALALAALVAACGKPEAGRQQSGPAANTSQVLRGDEAGVTPMNERVAVIGLLNKRNGIVRNLTMKPGQAIRVKDAVVRLRACETTAPWEQEKLTGAFLQLDVEGSDGQWRRAFSGWVYRESPSLNVVQHPVYDVWPKSCAMTFPAGPPPPSAPAASSSRSSAQNSPGPEAGGPEAEPEAAPEPSVPSPSAAANNAE